MEQINSKDKFGFLKTEVDVHTMGLASMSNLLRECGFEINIAPKEVMRAVESPEKLNNLSRITKWLKGNNITVLSFSYRLDPKDGLEYFCRLYHLLNSEKLTIREGGFLKLIVFSGLPDTCELIKKKSRMILSIL